MRIAIGAPGNGALLKDALEERLVEDGRVSDVLDLSTPEITYPEVSFQVARAVAEGRVDRGLLICFPWTPRGAAAYHLFGWSNSLGRDSMRRSHISLAVG